MAEKFTMMLFAAVSIIFFIAPVLVNAFYKIKTDRAADEILAGNAVEFNKQVKSNAVIFLVRRSIWGLLFVSLTVVMIRTLTSRAIYIVPPIFILITIGCFVAGFYGYRGELKRLKSLEQI